MTYTDCLKVLKCIAAMKRVGLTTTGHQVAKNIKSWSRSTTYRKLSKMQKLGLIQYVGEEHDNPRWIITNKGRYEMERQLRLPF